MADIILRPPGFDVNIEFADGDVNSVINNIVECHLVELGTSRVDKDGNSLPNDNFTLQEYLGSIADDWDDKTCFKYITDTLNKKVYYLDKMNIMAATSQLTNGADRCRFYDNNAAEISANSKIIEFMILATTAGTVCRSASYSDAAPRYDDTNTAQALSKIIGNGDYFISVQTIGLENGTVCSDIYYYPYSLNFDEWSPTSWGSGLRHFAYIQNVSGTRYFRDQILSANYSNGGISVEEGRNLFNISSQNPSAGSSPTNSLNVSNETLIAYSGKTLSSNNSIFVRKYGSTTLNFPIFCDRSIKIYNSGAETEVIAFDTTSAHWTYSADGYFIAIVVFNINKKLYVNGSNLSIPYESAANAMVNAGTRVFTNKDGALHEQTAGNGLTISNLALNINIPGTNPTLNILAVGSMSAKYSCSIVATKSSFSQADIQNVFNFMKRFVLPTT